MKKILLLLVISVFTINQLSSKDCGCAGDGRAYSWGVPDNQKCGSATGKAYRIIDHGTYQEKGTVDVAEAIKFCGF